MKTTKKSITAILISAFLLMNMQVFAAANGDYRSNTANGAWSSIGTWQMYNGSAWVAATAYPTSSNGVITIVNDDLVYVDVNITADQLIVNSGGTLEISSGTTLSINNGSGIDLLTNGTFIIDAGSNLTLSSGILVELYGTSTINGAINLTTLGDLIQDGTMTISSTGTITTTGGTYSSVVDIYGGVTFDGCNISTGYTGSSPTHQAVILRSGSNVTLINGTTWNMNGGYFTFASGSTLDIGDDCVITGYYAYQGSGNLIIRYNVGIAADGSYGPIQLTVPGSSDPYFEADGTYIYLGTGGQATGSGLTHVNPLTGALIINNSFGVSLTNPLTVSTGTLTVNGLFTPNLALTINGTGTVNGTLTTTATITIGSAGTCTVSTGGTMEPANSLVVNGTLTVNGLLTPPASGTVSGTGYLNGSGTVQVTKVSYADFYSQYTITSANIDISTLTVDYAGGEYPQNVTPLAYYGLKISNVDIYLTGNTSVSNIFTLNYAELTTYSNVLTIGANCAVVTNTGYFNGFVNGNVTCNIPAAPSYKCIFPVGIDDAGYLTTTFYNVNAGSASVTTTSGNEPNIGSSGLDASHSLYRYWTLTSTLTPGTDFTTYDATFDWYYTGDYEMGSDPTTFVVGDYNSNWTYPTINYASPNETGATGLAIFGDLQVAECGSFCRKANPNHVNPAFTDAVTLYPNPSSGKVTLDYQLTSNEGTMQLFDMVGKLVRSYHLDGSINQSQFDMSDLGSGIFEYRIINEGTVINKGKLVIMN